MYSNKVLIVEDDPKIADLLRRGLIYEGYQVEVRGDGESGLIAARMAKGASARQIVPRCSGTRTREAQIGLPGGRTGAQRTRVAQLEALLEPSPAAPLRA